MSAEDESRKQEQPQLQQQMQNRQRTNESKSRTAIQPKTGPSRVSSRKAVSLIEERNTRRNRVQKLLTRGYLDAAVVELLRGTSVYQLVTAAGSSDMSAALESPEPKSSEMADDNSVPSRPHYAPGLVFGTRYFNLVLNALGKACKTSECEMLFEAFEVVEVRKDVASYAIMMCALMTRKKYDLALEVYERLKRDTSVKPNAHIYCIVIQLYGALGKLHEAERFLNHVRSDKSSVRPTVAVYNALFMLYAKQGRHSRSGGHTPSNALKKALQMYEQMEATGLLGDAVTFGTLIHACAREKNLSRAFELFGIVRRRGIMPSLITYNSLVHACALADRPDLAFSVYSWMSVDKRIPDLYTYNSLLLAYSRLGDVDSAWEVFENLVDTRQDSITPDVFTYNTLISACIRGRNLRRAFQAFSMLCDKPASVAPDHTSFNLMIDACGKTWQLDEAMNFLTKMTMYQIRPTLVTYNSLLNACANAGDMALARLVYQRLLNDNLVPDVISLNTLVKGYCGIGDLARAESIVGELGLSFGVSPDRVTFNTFIHAYTQSSNLENAWKKLSQLQKSGFKPDISTINALSSACSKDFPGRAEFAVRLVKLMRYYGISADINTYATLIEACVNGGNEDEGFALYEQMISRHSGSETDVLSRSPIENLMQASSQMKRDLNGLGASHKAFLAFVASIRDQGDQDPKGGWTSSSGGSRDSHDATRAESVDNLVNERITRRHYRESVEANSQERDIVVMNQAVSAQIGCAHDEEFEYEQSIELS
ncbi:Pentatricopeptide repeat-containing protein [Porphyridium purpureum]|nr:Pentatricopeptide repeat-containing protein [Porphyridium purpureum]|eukprot:POR2997..scf249_10